MSKWGKVLFLVAALSSVTLVVARLFLGGWHDMLWVPLVVALLSFVGAFVVDFKFYFEFLTMRTTKHGMNMGVLIFLAVFMLVAVNFLGNRYNKNFDLTKEKLHSLSDQSVEAIKALQDELEILVFYQGKADQDLRNNIKMILQKYTDESPKVKIRFIDAYKDLAASKKHLGPSDRFAVIAQYQERTIRIEDPSQEEKVTSAILRIARKDSKSIVFLTGHQEKDINSEEPNGLKAFADALRADSYEVAQINLLTGDSLPDPQTGIIAIVGPKVAYMDSELQKIREFLREGGRLLLAIDPGESHQLANLSKTFGVEFKNNYVASEMARIEGTGLATVLGLTYDPASEVTKKFSNNDFSVFHLASEVVPAPDAHPGLTVKEIVKSHNSAFTVNRLDTPVTNPSRREHTLAVSVQGRIPAAQDKADAEAPAEPGKREFAAVVFGDSDFIINGTIVAGLNKDLALNAMAYLADESGLITIRPKRAEETPITITENRSLAIFTGGVAVPILLIITSGVLWYRRRNL